MIRSAALLLAAFLLTDCAKVRPPVVEAKVETPAPAPVLVKAAQPGELLKAAIKGDLELAQALVSRGANVNENVGANGHDLNPLLAAISKGHADLALFLLEKGASAHSSYGGYGAVEFSSKVFGATHPLTLKLGKRS